MTDRLGDRSGPRFYSAILSAALRVLHSSRMVSFRQGSFVGWWGPDPFQIGRIYQRHESNRAWAL